MSTWNPFTLPVDKMLLGNKINPGIVEIRNGKMENILTTQKPVGTIGAITLMNGRNLSTFTAAIEMWLPEHFEDWPAFRDVVDAKPGGYRPKSTDVVHPILADIGIVSVSIKGRTILTQKAPGLWGVDVFFQEYRRPKPGRAKPVGSQTEKKKDALDQEIDDLLSQVQQQELAGG